MDAWIDIRRKARQIHEKALEITKGDRAGHSLVNAILGASDLALRHVEPGKTFDAGVRGLLERENGIVNVARGQSVEEEALVIAHEIGHYFLHTDAIHEISSRPFGLGGDPLEAGAGKVEGYSTRERKEIQADIFAGEFLCPSNWLRDQFVCHGRRPTEIATELGLPKALVLNQMVRALLLPPLSTEPPPSLTHEALTLDESQQKAATWHGNVLVDAGPGTGKTRTLVARVSHLLGLTGPASILALTFSNKAAEEMRERISAVNPGAAIEMWAGTFHAFGLELIQKWPSAIGRTSKVRILDEAGQLALLEQNLEKLPLRHYQNLYEPAYELVNILRAISRCKDEGISSNAYLAEARSFMQSAQTEEDREQAERTIEIGEVYAIYEKALVEEDAADFGDLILLATKLIEENVAVRSYIGNFKYVLVDEYQDVNFASARLLKTISALGVEAWVVADQRQSIYRFRGAEPTNVETFTTDFGGSRHALNTNYRSFSPVVRTFGKFSTAMSKNRKMQGAWIAQRAEGGEVSLSVAENLSAEAEAIRDHILSLREKGVPYSDQVILARTHLTLARITSVLEQIGIPLLYLGDLFERDEIRTLLSLVSLDAEPGGIGLLRMGTLPEYGATREDVLKVIAWSSTENVGMFGALLQSDKIAGLSQAGNLGLLKLGQELSGLENASPWALLTTWLFERSEHLLPLLGANDTLSLQKLIAIYHLLKFSGEQALAGQKSRKSFLSHIRRLEALNYDGSFRRVASEAADLDAVRVMTIHGSKGLEFRAVHLPAVATRYMPSNRQANRCPPPPQLSRLGMQPEDHEDEEACLFFVALSRARDFLMLSRAERYTATKSSPSKFIADIAGTIVEKNYRGSGTVYETEVELFPPAKLDSYDEHDLATYMTCPARYRYTVIDGLRGNRDDSAYISFHRCIYKTVRWLELERAKGIPVIEEAALSALRAEWQATGPVEHAFEAYYRRAAESMIRSIVQVSATEDCTYDRAEWAIPVGNSTVTITPDRVLLGVDGSVKIQRIRTGRETKSEPDKEIYALLRKGASQKYSGKNISVESYYLSSSKSVPSNSKNDGKALDKYAAAIAGIEQGRFAPDPDTRKCPNCPSYFACKG